MLVYAVKQIIIRELEAERLRRAVHITKTTENPAQKKDDSTFKNNITKKPMESEINTNTKPNTSNVLNSTEQSKKDKTQIKEIVCIILILFYYEDTDNENNIIYRNIRISSEEKLR